MERPMAFISYARKDHRAAERLAGELASAGADPWLDTQRLTPGQDWKDAVYRAMEVSDFFIALISKESVAAVGYVQKELKDALEILDRLPPSRIYVIPARLDNSRPAYRRLHDLQWVDLFPNWGMGVARLFRAMGLEHDSTQIPDSLDLYVRDHVDLATFEWDERWGAGYALVYKECVGYDWLFVFWNEKERLMEKWFKYGELRWSGPERLNETDKVKIHKALQPGKKAEQVVGPERRSPVL